MLLDCIEQKIKYTTPQQVPGSEEEPVPKEIELRKLDTGGISTCLCDVYANNE